MIKSKGQVEVERMSPRLKEGRGSDSGTAVESKETRGGTVHVTSLVQPRKALCGEYKQGRKELVEMRVQVREIDNGLGGCTERTEVRTG